MDKHTKNAVPLVCPLLCALRVMFSKVVEGPDVLKTGAGGSPCVQRRRRSPPFTRCCAESCIITVIAEPKDEELH